MIPREKNHQRKIGAGAALPRPWQGLPMRHLKGLCGEFYK